MEGRVLGRVKMHRLPCVGSWHAQGLVEDLGLGSGWAPERTAGLRHEVIKSVSGEKNISVKKCLLTGWVIED